MPNNAADMYLVMLGAWRAMTAGVDWGVPASTIIADEAASDYLDRLWWSLDTAELIRVTEVMQADANRIRDAKRV